VPLIALGDRAEVLLDRVKGLEDFVPAVLELYPARRSPVHADPASR
jgi:hypothetical protein